MLEDALGVLAGHPVRRSAFEEARPHLHRFFGLLLPHRPAQDVGLAEAEAGHDLGDLHHLFLVDGYAVGLLEHVFERGQRVLDGLAAVLAVAERVDVLHGAGPVERVQRDQVLDAARPGLLEDALHAARLELERAEAAALAEHPERGGVVLGDVVRAGRAALLRHQGQRVLDHREGAQAEEVHLHEAAVLEVLHAELGGDRPGLRVAVQRHVLHQRLAADDDARRVGRGVPVQALELEADLDQLPLALAPPRHLLQARALLQRLGEVDLRVLGHELGDRVGLLEGEVEHPGHVADDRLRLEGSEGDHLPDLVRSRTSA